MGSNFDLVVYCFRTITVRDISVETTEYVQQEYLQQSTKISDEWSQVSKNRLRCVKRATHIDNIVTKGQYDINFLKLFRRILS